MLEWSPTHQTAACGCHFLNQALRKSMRKPRSSRNWTGLAKERVWDFPPPTVCNYNTQWLSQHPLKQAECRKAGPLQQQTKCGVVFRGATGGG